MKMSVLMWIGILAVFLLIPAALFIADKKRRNINRLKLFELQISLDALLNKGLDHAFCVFEPEDSDLWVQVRKYFDAQGDAALEISFPLADWTSQYVESLYHLLEQKCALYSTKLEDPKIPMEFVYVDCRDDVDYANELVSEIFVSVFKIHRGSKIIAKGSGIIYAAERLRHVSQLPKDSKELIKLAIRKKEK